MFNAVLKVNDIREMFKREYEMGHFALDKSGVKTIEIIGATFLADEDFIVRKPNNEYIKRELNWYKSQSLYVENIPGITPYIWEEVSDDDGKINSNYGWCIFSNENGNQYRNVLKALEFNEYSRQATMIYNRPSMHTDFNKNGMHDFVCTFSHTFFIRNDRLHSHYIMRSNDSVFGYGNDVAWAKYVQKQLLKDLQKTYPNLTNGNLIWTASNLHVYERHFPMLEKMIKNMKTIEDGKIKANKCTVTDSVECCFKSGCDIPEPPCERKTNYGPLGKTPEPPTPPTPPAKRILKDPGVFPKFKWFTNKTDSDHFVD